MLAVLPRIFTRRIPQRCLLQVKPRGRRWVSSEIQKKDEQAGESITATDTGVILKTEEETLIYFDNVYPRATSLWSPTQWYNILLTNQSRDAVRSKIMEFASPKNNPIHGLELRSTIPVKRDGGVFATFKVPISYSKAEVNSMIQKNTAEESSKTILSFVTRAAAFPVKGSPWIEDLRRLPSTVIKIKFEGQPLLEEETYSLFRRYGTIIDIFPPSNGGSTTTLRYRSFRGAICAKNCVSGMEVNNTVIHVQYQRLADEHMVRDFFVNHPRIAIPLLIALLSVVAVLIFDPIREFSIRQKISHRFTFSRDNYLIKEFFKLTSYTVSSFRSLLGTQTVETNKKQLWEERIEKVSDLKMWLEENNNTFVIVRGPRGSGKHDLVVQHTLHDRSNVLYLDCDRLIKSRTDSKFLMTAAAEIGYFPIFPWINSLTNVVDLAVQGLTGQKTGLSESKETQFRNMLTTAMVSIRQVALKGYHSTVGSGEDTIHLKEEDYLQQHPEKKPVIVIDRFNDKAEMNGFVYKELSDWAAMLVQMNIAHVIFLTETVSPNQLLSDSLPNQVFKTLILSDASKESARSYVLASLDHHGPSIDDDEEVKQEPIELSESVKKELDDSLEPLGGRMLDLQAFVRRVKSGEKPKEALEKMVEQALEQITQIFLGENVDQVKSAQASLGTN